MAQKKSKPLFSQRQLNILGFVFAIILIAIAGYILVRYQVVNLSGQVTNQTQDPTADWKKYTNKELEYEIKYPSDFSIKSANSITTISIHTEGGEPDLIITIEPLSETKFAGSEDNEILNILEDVGYNNLAQKFTYDTAANFIGDPPWGYYQIAIASQKIDVDSPLITVKIHRSDELTKAEGGTQGLLAETAKQILSTFRFSE